MKSVKVFVDPTRYQEVPRYRTKPGLPHTLNTPASNVSSGNDDFEGSSDMGNLEEEPVLGVRVGTILECLEGLLDTAAARLAQLGERRSAERKAVGSNSGRTNTQGL